MLLLLTTYPNNSRQLKKFIIWLINSNLAKCINKINYVKSFYKREWKLKKEEEKILLIKFQEKNKPKILDFFKKNHPYENPEIIFIKPDEIWDLYLKRINE